MTKRERRQYAKRVHIDTARYIPEPNGRTSMENVKMAVKGTMLTITVDLSKKGTPSDSKKTTLVASSRGSAQVPGHEDTYIGLNVFRYAAR